MKLADLRTIELPQTIVVREEYNFTYTENNFFCCGRGHEGCTYEQFSSGDEIILAKGLASSELYYTLRRGEQVFQITAERLGRCFEKAIFDLK